MMGPVLARDWLLLGAESLLGSPQEELVDVHSGFPVKGAEWKRFGEQLRAHSATPAVEDPRAKRLCVELGLRDETYWLLMLVAATELYPEAAAAASLLAEDERLHLLSPLTFARLLRAGLGTPFAEALREALPSGAARRLGLIEVVEALPGRPSTQHGLRLRAEELAALLDDGRDLAAARAVQVVRVSPAKQARLPGELGDGRGAAPRQPRRARASLRVAAIRPAVRARRGQCPQERGTLRLHHRLATRARGARSIARGSDSGARSRRGRTNAGFRWGSSRPRPRSCPRSWCSSRVKLLTGTLDDADRAGLRS